MLLNMFQNVMTAECVQILLLLLLFLLVRRYMCCECVCNCTVGNIIDMIDILKTFSFQAILNATVSVDTFFLLRFVFKFKIFICRI